MSEAEKRIINELKMLIRYGGYEAHTKMLDVQIMAAKLAVNPQMIRNVYQRLVQDGFLQEQSGQFYVVNDQGILNSYKKELLQQFEKDITLLWENHFSKDDMHKTIECVIGDNQS